EYGQAPQTDSENDKLYMLGDRKERLCLEQSVKVIDEYKQIVNSLPPIESEVDNENRTEELRFWIMKIEQESVRPRHDDASELSERPPLEESLADSHIGSSDKTPGAESTEPQGPPAQEEEGARVADEDATRPDATPTPEVMQDPLQATGQAVEEHQASDVVETSLTIMQLLDRESKPKTGRKKTRSQSSSSSGSSYSRQSQPKRLSKEERPPNRQNLVREGLRRKNPIYLGTVPGK
ncbi:MAG: hypothetical protein GY738_26400, partial [Pseudoalteromonas sp.]|nr:hypothetical protein [Pseudoalteromonas sp.]